MLVYLVSIFDPQEKLATGPPCEEKAEQCGSQSTNV